jgi:hypothetical protein
MKFTVEVSDFYLDEEGDIESQLKQFVIKDVVSQIQKSIESKINDAITLEVKDQVSKSLYRNIQKIVTEVISEGKIKGKNSRDGLVTIEEYIRLDIENNNGYYSPKEQIEKLAKQFGDDLKKRYDLLFASQIVAKLNENGFLREDAIKMLLQITEKK